jgi:hypothetical protein
VDEFPVIRHDGTLPPEHLDELYDEYRLSVHTDIRLLLQQFRMVDSVLRIVGVGSVGTRCYIALLMGTADEPLFIQIKEAPPSVLATFGGLDPEGNRRAAGLGERSEGWRVVTGQRVLQAASDPFLGWFSSLGRDFYCRQFRDMKGSFELDGLAAPEFTAYVGLCGAVLARGHAQSPGAAAVAAYLGNSVRFDEAMADWANACADQNERDHAALEAAVKADRLPAERGV